MPDCCVRVARLGKVSMPHPVGKSWAVTMLFLLLCADEGTGACQERPIAIVDEAAGVSHLVARRDPDLPPGYPWTGTPPEVILRATVDREGIICDLKPLAGPRELFRPAMNTVKRYWRYRPFLLDWKPAPVQFPIRVYFGPPKRQPQRVVAGSPQTDHYGGIGG